MKKRRWMPTKANLVKLSRAAPGCLGFEYCNKQELRLAYAFESGPMFDVWVDAGATVVGSSPLKENETMYPYARFLIRWPKPHPDTNKLRGTKVE